MTGTTVGHYEIQEKLGEGGMGMVFKARDVLLNRAAALKFLPPESCATEDRRRRFVQEAQSASALNHPNIITIYEIAQAENRDFIAMELVKGRTLDQAIGSKGLGLGEALTYAIQVADALAAAHGAGIVHRDLKPGNIMVTDTGLVKVLDFGLAKLISAGDGGESEVTKTILAQQGPKTAEGSIVGTVSYMSPEQAEGKRVDHRSDIFAFGAVLYEMLTGKRAFQGESAVSTMAAILTAEPAALARDAGKIPGDLARIVNRCLRKPAEKRWQSMADIRIALEEFKQDLDSGQLAAPAASVRAPRRGWTRIAAAALLAAGLTGFIVWRMRPAPEAPHLWRVRRLTADAGTSLFPAISPDGKLVAYSSDRAATEHVDLWVQQIEGGDPVRLTHDLGPWCRNPAFSPDGSKIVFECGIEAASVYVVSTFGGLPRKLADGESPQFSPDGSQISYIALDPGATGPPRSIWIMPAGGGTAKELKTNLRNLNRDRGTVWSPDGKGLLAIGADVRAAGPDDWDWYYISIDGGSVTPTGARSRLQAAGMGRGRDLGVTPGGLLFADGNIFSANIYRMPFTANFQKVSGNPVPVIAGAGFNFGPTASQDGRRIAFTAAINFSVNIWRAALDSSTGKVAGDPVRVTSGVDPSYGVSPSRDGRRLAYLGGSAKTREVRIRDMESGKDLRLAEAGEQSYAVLSPDGSTVAFTSDSRQNSPIYTVPAIGGIPKKICNACGRPVEWVGAGAKILHDYAGPRRRDIQILDVASGESKPLLHHAEYPLNMPRGSPDGRLLCFTSLRPGRARRIYLAPFTGEPVAEKDWTVLVEGMDLDRQPFWAPSGNLIYFQSDRDGSRCIWAQRVDPATQGPVGAPFAVHHMHQVRYNLQDVGDPALVGLSIANGQMFYASAELQSNIWVAERSGAEGR